MRKFIELIIYIILFSIVLYVCIAIIGCTYLKAKDVTYISWLKKGIASQTEIYQDPNVMWIILADPNTKGISSKVKVITPATVVTTESGE